jgi:uncharacterized protein involved in exopolysaccharide biosynthesis
MEKKELTLLEMWNLIWERRKFIAKIVIPVTILAIIVSLLMPKWYKATAVILPPTADQGPFNVGNLIGQLGVGGFLGSNEDQNRFMAILKSRTLLESIAQKYNLQEKYEADDMEKTLLALEGNIQIDIGEENQIIISILDQDQEMVAEMANYVVHALDSLNIALHTSRAHSSREFIESRLAIVVDSLMLLEKETTKFMEKEGVLSLDEQVRVGISKAADLKAAIMSKEIELEVARRMVQSSNPNVRKLEIELESLKHKYQEFYSPSSDKLFLDLENVPELAIKYIQLQRKTEYYTKVLEFLAPQFEQAKIEEAKEIPTVQVLDYGVRPERKEKPRRAKLVIFVFMATSIFSAYLAYFSGRKKQLTDKN